MTTIDALTAQDPVSSVGGLRGGHIGSILARVSAGPLSLKARGRPAPLARPRPARRPGASAGPRGGRRRCFRLDRGRHRDRRFGLSCAGECRAALPDGAGQAEATRQAPSGAPLQEGAEPRLPLRQGQEAHEERQGRQAQRQAGLHPGREVPAEAAAAGTGAGTGPDAGTGTWTGAHQRGQRRRRDPLAAGQHVVAQRLRDASGGPDADGDDGRLERDTANHLRLPVAALRLERRRLQRDLRRHHVDVHGDQHRRRKHAASRRRDRHELLGSAPPSSRLRRNTSPPTITGNGAGRQR